MLSSNMKWIWINIVFLTFLTACTEKKKTEWERYVANEVRAHLNKDFLYPDSAFTLFSCEDLDSFKKNNGRGRILLTFNPKIKQL